MSPPNATASSCSSPVLRFAHGILLDVLVSLVEAGFAELHIERVRAGNKVVEIARLKIMCT